MKQEGVGVMNIPHDIRIMDRELTNLGVEVKFSGAKCLTVAGDHQDFGTLKEVRAYLSGCLVFVHSRPFDQSPSNSKESQSEGS